jgi:hypothetical protein
MRKLEALKVREVQKKQKKKTQHVLWVGKLFFFSLLFFHYSFFFALQRWFLKLEVELPQHFKSLKVKHRWQRSKELISDRVVIDDGQFYGNVLLFQVFFFFFKAQLVLDQTQDSSAVFSWLYGKLY